MRALRLLTMLTSALLLAGCGTLRPASVRGGECRLVATPKYAVLGKTSYDQKWVDRTTESIVAGCRQPRPKPRPAALDKPVTTPVALPPQQPAGKPPKPKRKWQFWRGA